MPGTPRPLASTGRPVPSQPPSATGILDASGADGARRPVVPLVLIDALLHLGAPKDIYYDRGRFLDWATTSLGMQVLCGPRQGSTTRGRAWHFVSVDPRTGRAVPAPTAREEAKATTSHLLWALTSADPAPCMLVEEILRYWVGPVRPRPGVVWQYDAPWADGKTHETALAVRTVLRAVGYLDVGIDLGGAQGWLANGVTGDALQQIRGQLAEAGASGRELALERRVSRWVGRYALEVGHTAVTHHAWLDQFVAEWLVRDRSRRRRSR